MHVGIYTVGYSACKCGRVWGRCWGARLCGISRGGFLVGSHGNAVIHWGNQRLGWPRDALLDTYKTHRSRRHPDRRMSVSVLVTRLTGSLYQLLVNSKSLARTYSVNWRAYLPTAQYIQESRRRSGCHCYSGPSHKRGVRGINHSGRPAWQVFDSGLLAGWRRAINPGKPDAVLC